MKKVENAKRCSPRRDEEGMLLVRGDILVPLLDLVGLLAEQHEQLEKDGDSLLRLGQGSAHVLHNVGLPTVEPAGILGEGKAELLADDDGTVAKLIDVLHEGNAKLLLPGLVQLVHVIPGSEGEGKACSILGGRRRRACVVIIGCRECGMACGLDSSLEKAHLLILARSELAAKK